MLGVFLYDCGVRVAMTSNIFPSHASGSRDECSDIASFGKLSYSSPVYAGLELHLLDHNVNPRSYGYIFLSYSP